MPVLDVTSFVYSALLVGGLIKAAEWLAPYEGLTEAGCTLDYVYDGDTVALRCGDAVETARLVGLDTPETKDPGCPAEGTLGQQATERLRELSQSGKATFAGRGFDKYGRRLVVMRVDGRDVSGVLVSEGLAVAYHGGARPNWCERLGA